MSPPAAPATRPPITDDRQREIEQSRVRRLAELERRCLFLQGERDRAERLLAQLLWWVTDDPATMLTLLCMAVSTEPGKAAIHQ